MDDSNLNDAVFRKLFEFDRLCFKKCVNTPERKLTSTEEFCLSKIDFRK